MVTELKHPVIEHELTRLRDKDTGIAQFRRSCKILSIFLAIEALRDTRTKVVKTDTPLIPTSTKYIDESILLVPILRAGVALIDGFLDIIPGCNIAYHGMKRNEETIEPEEYYSSVPVADSAKVIVLEVMLATGGSAELSIRKLIELGYKDLTFVSIISAPEGIEKLEKEFPDLRLITCSIDEGLNDKSYIIPGLGDAGDRYHGC